MLEEPESSLGTTKVRRGKEWRDVEGVRDGGPTKLLIRNRRAEAHT